MMTCEEFRDLSTLALYGELEHNLKEAFDAHLASCGQCRAEYDGLRATLALMSRRERTELSEKEWGEFDRKLEENIAAAEHAHGDRTGPVRTAATPPRPRIFSLFPSVRPAWGYGIAAVFLLAVGFFIGRTFIIDTGLIGNGGAPAASTAGQQGPDLAKPSAPGAATSDALDYLERSRNLLLGVTNLDARQAGSIDFSRQQRISRELYDRGNVLTVALNKPSEQQLRQLVQQLQIILLQLANMEVGNGMPAVELVRQGVNSNSILLKINLEAIRAGLDQKQAGAASANSRQNL